jgi:hypothetical protein
MKATNEVIEAGNKIELTSGAIFSDERKYRYILFRIWDATLPRVMIIGLNPSTANENKNDNTITKCIKVAKNNGYGGFYMANLFGIVSADPKILLTADDPIGQNDFWIEKYKCKDTVFAWGNFEEAKERSKQMIPMFENPLCFQQNKNGSPKHPLYCKDDTIFKFYNSQPQNKEI